MRAKKVSVKRPRMGAGSGAHMQSGPPQLPKAPRRGMPTAKSKRGGKPKMY
jgi:hypothetical protein